MGCRVYATRLRGIYSVVSGRRGSSCPQLIRILVAPGLYHVFPQRLALFRTQGIDNNRLGRAISGNDDRHTKNLLIRVGRQ